ncbi:LytTR family transcriptional regulator DNA-binding domain-containing protein [Flagellimonas sp. DF-77]|uniref:LytR/AlgR family response regulator transcription factor n=1 Tax=Flagellimonas algarum TaxID=3230298 RepID=UPI003393DEFB
MDYTYAIIDENAANGLHFQVQLQEFGEFSCAGIVGSPDEGLNFILKALPDLVIVNLGEQAGNYLRMVVELHQYLQKIPLLIAVSRTKNYAYEAIKHGFYDYWLLPSNEFDIRKTVLKLRKQSGAQMAPTTLCLKTYRDFHYIDTRDILYLKADNNATDFVMRHGDTISAFKTLKSFESVLPKNFIRIHQSYILNTDHVSRINYGKSTCTLKYQETHLPFSKNYRDRVDQLKFSLSKNSIWAPK